LDRFLAFPISDRHAYWHRVGWLSLLGGYRFVVEVSVARLLRQATINCVVYSHSRHTEGVLFSVNDAASYLFTLTYGNSGECSLSLFFGEVTIKLVFFTAAYDNAEVSSSNRVSVETGCVSCGNWVILD
jgi:hypothetical protein